ncbi:hypothetical protein BH23BAC1_BH23BAC1_10410 [soil metagenome]
MAEINIQKKRKPVWPWIIGLIIAAAVIWIVLESVDREEVIYIPTATDQTTPQQTTPQQSDATADMADQQAYPQEVNNFISFVRENDSVEEMNLDHDYTADGIRLLSMALSDLVDRVGAEDINMQQKKENLKRKADRIQRNPQATYHADTIRSAFISSAELMEDLENNHFSNVDNQVDRVRETAEAIDPNTETLNQRTKVKAFFASSSQALHAMADELNQNN